ncbi:hypothetical protein CHARACLAT_031463, partial [Characodon lateralis]|nr:hypothetical protein [Characodon lateralis]
QVTEEEKGSKTQQNGVQQREKKPSEESKRKNRIKKQTVLETETENPQTSFDQSETKLKVSEEEELSPPQTKYKVVEDVIPTPPQGSETQAAKELHVQDNSCEQEDNSSEQKESPVKKVSLWRRLKKQLTPSHRRQYKDKQENRPQ